MYLSDRDLAWALSTGKLIVDPPPATIDPTSIDLRLSAVSNAKIWDIGKFSEVNKKAGRGRPELRIGQYDYSEFSKDYLIDPPNYSDKSNDLVSLRGDEIIVRPTGFVLWTTVERVGTPEDLADLICFVDGKSTRARAGILVHLTAPTIHSSWKGKITLEIFNAGPFDFVLKENDVIAQITVAKIASCPEKGMNTTSKTFGQEDVRAIIREIPTLPKAK